MHYFLAVIEKTSRTYSAYLPDLPGCAATGETCEELERNMRGAIEMDVRGLLEDNLPVTESNSLVEYIAV